MTAREVGAQDLGFGELGPLGEVVLGVQTDAHTWRDTTAPTRALVGRRLRHRLDRQPLHLEPLAVPRDASGAGVDDVADAGHGDRRLGHVGRQHDATPSVRLEDAVLLGRRQSRVERQDLELSRLDLGTSFAADRVGDVVDLALTAQEHEDVAVADPFELARSASSTARTWSRRSCSSSGLSSPYGR